MLETLTVRTHERVEFVSLTSEVDRLVRDSEMVSGLCVVYVPHTTAGVIINENADPSVVRDMIMELNKAIPFEDGYTHLEGNSAAHIKASLMGSSQTIPIENGQLVLGTWQGIFFCEFDGPRTRKLVVKLLAEHAAARPFTFEDLAQVEESHLRIVLADVPDHTLLLALRATSVEHRKRFLGSLPTSQAKTLSKELEKMEPVPVRAVEAAQREITSRALSLEVLGEIVIECPSEMLI